MIMHILSPIRAQVGDFNSEINYRIARKFERILENFNG